MTIRVAATLRLFDHIAAGTQTTEALAAAVDADRDALGRRLRHMVTAGGLPRAETGTYGLMALGQHLVTMARIGYGPGSIWRVLSGTLICALPNCCTPSVPANPRSPRQFGRRSGTTCRPTPGG